MIAVSASHVTATSWGRLPSAGFPHCRVTSWAERDEQPDPNRVAEVQVFP